MSFSELNRLAESVLAVLWRSSWQASVLAGMVLALQLALRNHLPARWRHTLWIVVLLRLLVPVTPPSPFSLFNFAPQQPEIAQAVSFLPQTIATPLAVSPEAPPIAAPATPWMLILAFVWLSGALALLARITCASVHLSLLVRRMTVVRDASVLELLDRCRAELHVSRRPEVLTSQQIAAPALMGFLRPRLLVPQSVLTSFSPAELKLILLHELAHLKRHDVAINWLASILQAIHWFNPVLHLAFARLRSDRELAADELVLAQSSAEQRNTYGHTIVKLLQTLSGSRPGWAGTVGILEHAHPMKRRITMIAQFTGITRRGTLAVASTTMVLLIGVGLTDRVRGDTPAPAAPAASTTRPAEAAKPSDDLSAWPTAKGANAEEKAFNALQGQVPELRLDSTPLSDVIDFLRDVTGANITVNWRTLESAGIDRNTPCSIQLKDVRMDQVLRHLLDEVGGGSVDLSFGVSNGSILISTTEQLDSKTQFQAYDISGLGSDSDAILQVVNRHVRELPAVEVLSGRLLVTGTTAQQLQVAQVLDELKRVKPAPEIHAKEQAHAESEKH